MDRALSRTTESLRDLPVPWHVAGGWAIDLFLRRVTRAHQDVDVAVARDDQRALFEHLDGWSWTKIVPHPERLQGRATTQAWRGEHLALPTHQVIAESEHRIEFLMFDVEDGRWLFRRNPEVTLPMKKMARTSPDGLSFLSPEIVLLFKAKDRRPHDEADLGTTLPRLNPEQRHWLHDALQRTHPDHPWLARLASETSET